jgi:hypothetical protein
LAPQQKFDLLLPLVLLVQRCLPLLIADTTLPVDRHAVC